MLVHPFNDLAGFKVIIDCHLLTHCLQTRFVAGIVNDRLYCFQVPGKGPSFYFLWGTTLVMPVSRAACGWLGDGLLLNNGSYDLAVKIHSKRLLYRSLGFAGGGDELFTALSKKYVA